MVAQKLHTKKIHVINGPAFHPVSTKCNQVDSNASIAKPIAALQINEINTLMCFRSLLLKNLNYDKVKYCPLPIIINWINQITVH